MLWKRGVSLKKIILYIVFYSRLKSILHVVAIFFCLSTNEIKRPGGARLSSVLTSSLLWVDEHNHSSIQQNLSLIQTSNFIPSRSVLKLYLRST